MLIALMTTRVDRSDAVGGARWAAYFSGLGAWPWYLAGAVCVAVADRLSGWPSLIPLTVGLVFGLYGLTSYCQGRDGLSKHRQ